MAAPDSHIMHLSPLSNTFVWCLTWIPVIQFTPFKNSEIQMFYIELKVTYATFK